MDSSSHASETILQFGAGRFLRAFADLFVHRANLAGQNAGRIVVVQSTGRERADALVSRQCKYSVAIRGLAQGVVVDETFEVGSIRRCLIANQDWPQVLEVALSPSVQTIISNTTERGYELADDRPTDDPPAAFPAKLARVLWARKQAGLPGLTLFPCELFERNGDRLLAVVREQAKRWDWPADFDDWLVGECRWRNSLVDRIVSGPPAEHPLSAVDPLLISTEPYALWAIEHPANQAADPGQFFDPAIARVPDVSPFHLRKVRILNGAHTALVEFAMPKGFTTVRAAVVDPVVADWLEGLLFEEIVPTVALKVDGAEEFARQTLERFRNPFLEHQLADIALHHTAKKEIRIRPTYEEFAQAFGKSPRRLKALLDS